ncbi:MAG: aspartate carbamoyltransferase catalytic subunit [Rhodobacteraceae bacterium]|nr:aspartate carbamoyltransferase catalytic subunit [Paracoccaceae bacterium]
MTVPDGWQGILDEGERILWQGRPDGRVVWKPRHFGLLLFGGFFAGFALFWMIMASQAGGLFWMFGLLHFSVGIALMLGGPYGGAYIRRHSWYTLTDRRAFIATDMPMVGRRLNSYPIDRDSVLQFAEGDPSSVYFATILKRTKNGSRRVPVGFENIEDAREVYGLLRDVQRGEASAEDAG